MPKEPSESRPTGHSRRNFLVKLTLGVTALAGASIPLARLGKGGGKRESAAAQEFPGPDSIFHPAQDPRRDPRRKST